MLRYFQNASDLKNKQAEKRKQVKKEYEVGKRMRKYRPECERGFTWLDCEEDWDIDVLQGVCTEEYVKRNRGGKEAKCILRREMCVITSCEVAGMKSAEI